MTKALKAAAGKVAPEGFRWWKSPSGMVVLTTDMRTKKGKELIRMACELIYSPQSQ